MGGWSQAYSTRYVYLRGRRLIRKAGIHAASDVTQVLAGAPEEVWAAHQLLGLFLPAPLELSERPRLNASWWEAKCIATKLAERQAQAD